MLGSTAVIFDLFKTLIDIQTDEEIQSAYEFVSTWLSYKGMSTTPQDLYRSYKDNRRLEFAANPVDHPDIDVRDVFYRMLSALNLPAAEDQEQIVREVALLFRILTTKSLTIYPETVPVLTQLHDSGKVRLAIVSNTQRLFTMPELTRFGLQRYFECIVFSSDVKACKPNARIFNTALERMRIEPQQAIYVGDNPFDDVWGAQRVGLKTIWIDRGEAYEFPDDFGRPSPSKQIMGWEFGCLPEIVFSMIEQ